MWAHTCMLFWCQHIHVILDKMSVLAPQSDRDAATEPFAWHSGGGSGSPPTGLGEPAGRRGTKMLTTLNLCRFRRLLCMRDRRHRKHTDACSGENGTAYGEHPFGFRSAWSGALESRSVTRHPRELGKTRVHVNGQKDMPALCLILRAAAAALLCSVGVEAFRLPTLHVTSQRWAVCCPRICAQSSHSEQSHSPLR